MKVFKSIVIILLIFSILLPYTTVVQAISEFENDNEVKNEIDPVEDIEIKEESKENEVSNNIIDNNLNNEVIDNIITNEIKNEITNNVENITNNEIIENEISENVIQNTIKNEVNENISNNTIISESVKKDTIDTNDDENNLSVVSGINDVKVEYSTHVQNIGWQEAVYNGQMSGTSGLGLRLEAIKINVVGENLEGAIKYSTHVQNIGWQDYVTTNVNSEEENIAVSGSLGLGFRLEAIKIELEGNIAEEYDIYYRVHGEIFGWSGWAKNGEEAGSMGYGLRLEAIEIKLIKKGEAAPGSTENKYYIVNPNISYTTHVQNIGWQEYVKNGAMAGTSNKGLRLEAIKIKLDNCYYEGGIEYTTHVENIGWLDSVTVNANEKAENVAFSGTSGKSLRLEAIKIKLTGEVAEKFDIYYRVHGQNVGWLDWAKNGEEAGTEGYGFRLEGIEIKLVKKGEAAPGETAIPFKKNFSGRITIDTPTVGSEYTVPSKDEVSDVKLSLKGWAISTDEEAYIEVLINGEKISEKVVREIRTDVNTNKIQGWDEAIENTAKSGYSVDIDISNLKENTHTLTVNQKNRYGDIITRKEIKFDVKTPRYLGKMVIDSPVKNKEIVIAENNSVTETIRGWAISEDSKAKINLYLNGELICEGVTRTNRSDVNSNSVKDCEEMLNATEFSGYESSFTFDSSMLPGEYIIKVEQVSRFGHVITSTESVVNLINENYTYTGYVHIDEPTDGRLLIKERNDSFKIRGWATSTDSKAKIQIYIDDSLFDSDAVREERIDINETSLPNRKKEILLTPCAGFTTIDLPVNVLGLAEGVHTITVKQIDRYGKLITEVSITVRVIERTYKGVDVSRHNGTVDWKSVVDNGFSFAILRVGYGKNSDQKDPMFEENYKKCKELGISVGVYLYSYAMDPAGATLEAENCLNWLNGRQLDLPVYYDLENTTSSYPQHTIPKETQTQMVINFCDKIQSAGYRAGIYTSKNWMEDNLDMSQIENRYSVWLAHYTEGMDKVFMPTYNPLPTNYQGKYNMWQYTSKGNINGQTFDFNIFYY